jgi:hypothetical protein
MKRILAVGMFCSLGLSVWAAPANVDWSNQRQRVAARATPEWAIWERMPRIAQSVVSSWEASTCS